MSKIDNSTDQIQAIKVDYDFYFKNTYGIFIFQTQMKHVDFLAVQTKVKLQEMFTGIENF